jgi:hypothetical protein
MKIGTTDILTEETDEILHTISPALAPTFDIGFFRNDWHDMAIF